MCVGCVLSLPHNSTSYPLLSDFSDNLVFKSGAGVPSPPLQPILTEASVGHLALKWAPPTDNGGSLIVSYCLEMDDPEMVIDGSVWSGDGD